MVDFGMDPQESLDAARFCVAPKGEGVGAGVGVAIEPGIPDSTVEDLRKRGALSPLSNQAEVQGTDVLDVLMFPFCFLTRRDCDTGHNVWQIPHPEHTGRPQLSGSLWDMEANLRADTGRGEPTIETCACARWCVIDFGCVIFCRPDHRKAPGEWVLVGGLRSAGRRLRVWLVMAAFARCCGKLQHVLPQHPTWSCRK